MHSELDVETVLRTAVLEAARDSDVDPEDLYQEVQAWALAHADLIDYYRGMHHPASAAFYLRRDALRPLRAYIKKEKAYREGFEVADCYTYSAQGIELRGLLAECIRAIVTGTREPARVETEGKSNTDPSEASNSFLVSMLDIERGWRKLEDEDKRLLAAFFVYDVGVMALAEEYGTSDRQVYNRLKSALRRLVGPLNGGL